MRTKGFIKYLPVKGNESYSYSRYLYRGLEYQQLDFSVKTKSQIIVFVSLSYKSGGQMKYGGPRNHQRQKRPDGDKMSVQETLLQNKRHLQDAQVTKFCKGIKRKDAEVVSYDCVVFLLNDRDFSTELLARVLQRNKVS